MGDELAARAVRAGTSVTLGTYNTVALASGGVYYLVTPYAGPYYYNVLNLGPCTVYMRADADPVAGDPLSVTLPPGCADNLVVIPEGTDGLGLVAGPPCIPATGQGSCAPDAQDCATVTLRLVRG